MRLTTVLAAAMLLGPSLAHADEIYTYTGTLIANGQYASFNHDDGTYTVFHDYRNEPVSATMTIDYDKFPDIVEAISIDLPNFNYPENYYPESSHCDNPGPCIEIYFETGTTPPYTDIPFALDIAGDTEPDFTDSNPGYYGDVYGTLPLAATPEPSSFALLGTGLLGVAGVMRRRWA